MRTQTAIIVAFFGSPCIPSAYGCLSTPIVKGPLLWESFLLFPVFYAYSLAAMVLFGMPAFYLGHKTNLIRWWSALVAGTIIGAILAVLIRLPDAVQRQDLVITCPLGALTAVTFWLIWKSGRD